MGGALDLSALRVFVVSLPGVAEAPHFEMGSARIGGRIFATWPPDGSRVHVFLDGEGIAAAVASGLGEELYWGKKLAGLRVLLPADRAALEAVLVAAWRRKAPRRVVAAHDARFR